MSDDDDLVFRRAKATTLDELDEYLETFNVLPSGRSAKTTHSRRPMGATARMQPLPSWSSSEEESYYQQRLKLSRLSPHSPYQTSWSPSTSSNGDQGLDAPPSIPRAAPKEAPVACREAPRFQRGFHADNDPLHHRLSSHIALFASVQDDLVSEPELIGDEILDHSNRRRSKASHQTNTARSMETCEIDAPIFKHPTSMSDRQVPSQTTATSWAVTQIFSRAGLAYLKGNLMEPFEKDILNYADFEIEADGFVLEPSRCRKLTEKFFRSWAWELTVWFFAIANAVVVCCNVEWELHPEGPTGRLYDAFKLLELLYLVGFWMEMALQLGVFGSRFFVDMFAVMDLVILFFSLVPFGVAGALYGYDSPQARAFQSFSIARVLRVLRVVHIVRFDSLFREFWILVRGITYSLRVLLWGMSVGFLLIFVFAVPVTVFLGENPNISGTYNGWQMDMVGVDIREYTSVGLPFALSSSRPNSVPLEERSNLCSK
ncbi:MAG: uncharacterized protein KVP18_003350 [Porospora cf. gigantea A]|uniref:uncharacterized protein n=1 Tax=Porospora cf. gigantea A TaxID=2853593 RepID=UPI00355A5E7E|nr:MAG: hypothetical protein KVP18_003350 [Porospora cf. gigantea A]